MKRLGIVIAVVAGIASSYVLGRRHASPQIGSETGRHILYYVDPMHPAYKSDKPGIAPDCGMNLEPVYSEDPGNAPSTSTLAQLSPGTVSIDGATQQLLGIRLVQAEKGGATRILRVVGRVVPEDTRVYKVNSGTAGVIKETYNDSVGTRVMKDQKLASFYSPDFLAVASGFLAATERVPGFPNKDGNRTLAFPGAVNKQGVSSTQGYADRLRNFGMSDAQIRTIAESRLLPEYIDVVAPADGFILTRNITPGLHFDPSVEFYRIANLSKVWVVAEVYEQDAPFLHPGGRGEISWGEQGRQLPAHITDSLPASEAGGGTVKVRLEVDNPGFALRPEMLVDVKLPLPLPASVTVPLDAVIDSGAHARVYVERSEGIFEPREVETGWQTGERVEILHGLQPGERVVAAATFLVDSESRLKAPASASALARTLAKPASAPARAVAAKMAKDPSCGMLVDPASAEASGNTLVYRGTTYYFCSQHCKEAFQKNPGGAINMKQAGGR